MRTLGTLLLFLWILACETEIEKAVGDFKTPYELDNGNETATYEEAISFYIQLAKEFPEISIQSAGNTDIGKPLHIVTFNPDGDFNFQKIGRDKSLILINNGIHPGESDGIDATMLLFRDLALKRQEWPKNVVLTAIPVYNIGGALNRNSKTRVNQNGPATYGFRGNAQNYDLNRDFIKNDTENARSFAAIFHLIKPDLFVDTHVSNGADYQYVLTHLFTQHNRLGGSLGRFLHEKLQPGLEDALKNDKWDITPYVNVFNRVPESGFSQFMDGPRYSTGYATLWNTFGLMVETHMLKPYSTRVAGTYTLLSNLVRLADSLHPEVKKLRNAALTRHRQWNYYPIKWKVDSSRTTVLNFKGFEADTLESALTGFPRLKYNRHRPFQKEVTYYDYFKPTDSVAVPHAYLIPKGWGKIIPFLERNQIDYQVLEKDTLLLVEAYTIADYKTRNRPYEGHYLHYDTKVNAQKVNTSFSQGDIYIHTDQPGIRYLLETLEPAATDSFFNRNFFDPILQRKEGFSPYVFEEVAQALLEKNEELRLEFDTKKQNDESFSNNWYAQLSWLYGKSEHSESSFMHYPVYRVLKQ